MPEPRSPEAGAPLSAQVFQILLSLLDGDMHGYALIQDIRHRTDDEIVLTASTLYAAVKRMLGVGWIEEVQPEDPPPDHDERRRYYRMTALGRAAARAEAQRLERLTTMARDKRLLRPLGSTPQPKGTR
jgi:DNA-binding PadR family transcriptional regulator